MTNDNTLHRQPPEMRDLAYERAGGSAGDDNYDPDLLATITTAADEIERLPVKLIGTNTQAQPTPYLATDGRK